MMFVLNQCFSKWGESPPWGRFWWVRGRKKQRGRKCSPLIDHWVNVSSLLLWLVSFLQIIIYYDNNRWRLLISNLSVEFVLWIVYVFGCSVDYFRAAKPSEKWHLFMSMASAPEFLVFMNVAPDLSFFMAPDPAPASRRFHMLTH